MAASQEGRIAGHRGKAASAVLSAAGFLRSLPGREELIHKAIFVVGFWLFYLSVQGGLGVVLDYWDMSSAMFIGELLMLGLAGVPSTLLAILIARPVIRAPLILLPLIFVSAYPLEIFEAFLFRSLLGWANLFSYEGDEFVRVFFLLFYASTFYVALMGGLVAIDYYLKSRREALATAHAAALAQEAQVAMLRYQLNPHFLFNTLNSLSALILENRNTDAERMVEQLSRFLRRTVDARAGQKVTLENEMETLTDYLEVEKVRFGDRLQYAIVYDADAAGVLVPSLLLQPIVENAVRHAVARRVGDGTIAIEARIRNAMTAITIRDNGPGFDDPDGTFDRPTGVGLRNIASRLSSLYGANATIKATNAPGGGARIDISLPVERAS